MSRTISLTKSLAVIAFAAGILCFSDCALAQVTIQLPIQRSFGVQTVVSVPDGGSSRMGGVNAYATGSVGRGVPLAGNIPIANRLFRNQAIGNSISPTSQSVHVQIISLQEMEEDVMREAASRMAGAANERPQWVHPGPATSRLYHP